MSRRWAVTTTAWPSVGEPMIDFTGKVVADRCILADGSVVAQATRVFGEVMTMSRGELEIVRETASVARETAPFELVRRMGRTLFPNAAWTRFPAAQ